MGLTTTADPANGPLAVPAAVDRRTLEQAPAGVIGRLLAVAAVLVAAGTLAAAADVDTWVTQAVVAFLVGVAVSFVPSTERWFRHISGVAAGWVLFVVLLTVSLLANISAGAALDGPWQVLLLPLVLLGADWHQVGRLRVRVLVAGTAAVVGVGIIGWEDGIEAGEALVLGLVWLGLASVTMWVLQRDQLASLPRPAPLDAVGPPRPRLSGGALALVAGVSAAAALLLALLLTSPGWNPFGGESDDAPQQAGEVGGEPVPGVGGQPPGGAGGGSGASGAGGNVYVDDSGGVYVYDEATDRFVAVPDAAQVDEQGRPWPPRADPRQLPGGSEVVGGEARDGRLYGPDGRQLVPRDSRGAPLTGGSEGPGGGAPTSGSGAGTGPGASGEEPSSGREPWLLLAAAAALVAGALLLLWLWRSDGSDELPPTDRPWAAAMARRLEALGVAHGRPREPDEPVTAFGLALAARTDHRMVEVAQVVSAGLFGRAEPPPDVQRRVEEVIAELEAGPVPAGAPG